MSNQEETMHMDSLSLLRSQISSDLMKLELYASE